MDRKRQKTAGLAAVAALFLLADGWLLRWTYRLQSERYLPVHLYYSQLGHTAVVIAATVLALFALRAHFAGLAASPRAKRVCLAVGVALPLLTHAAWLLALLTPALDGMGAGGAILALCRSAAAGNLWYILAGLLIYAGLASPQKGQDAV